MKNTTELKKLYTQLQRYFITLNKLAEKNIGQLISEEEISVLVNFPTSKKSKEPVHPAKALIEVITTYLSRNDQEKKSDPIIQKKIIALFFDKDEQRRLKVDLIADSELVGQQLNSKRKILEEKIAKSKDNTDTKDYVSCINLYVFEMMDKLICLDRYKKINDIIKNSGKLPAEVSKTVTVILTKVLADEGRTVDSTPTFLKLSEIDDWKKVEKELKAALPAIRQPIPITATVGSSAAVVTNTTTTHTGTQLANTSIESVASTSTAYTQPVAKKTIEEGNIRKEISITPPEILSLAQALTEKEEEITELKFQLELALSGATEVRALQARIEQLEGQLKRQSDISATLSGRNILATLRGLNLNDIDELRKKNHQLEALLKGTEKELDSALREKENVYHKNKSLDAKIAEANQLTQEAEVKVQQLQQQKESTETKESRLQQELEDLKLQLRQAQEKTEKDADQIQALQEKITKLFTPEVFEHAQQKAHQANDAVRQLQAEKDEAYRNFSEAVNRVSLLENERDEKSEAIQTLTNKLNATIAKLDAEKQTREDLKLQFQQAQEKAITNENTRVALQAEIAQLKLLETQLRQAQEKTEKDASQIQNLQAQVAKIGPLELRLQQAKEETAKRISDLQATIDQRPTQEQLLRAEKQLESYKQTIDGLQKAFDDAKQQHALEMERLTESLAYEQPTDNPNESRNPPEMSANSANSYPQSPGTIRSSDEQNQGETEMPAMKDSQPIVTTNSSSKTIHDESKRGEGKILERNDSISSSSSGVSTGSTESGEESTPTSSSESGGDNDTKHKNNNIPGNYPMAACEEICKEILVEIIREKITEKTAATLPHPLLAKDLDDSLAKNIQAKVISEVDASENEESTKFTRLVESIDSQLSEGVCSNAIREETKLKILEQFRESIDALLAEEIQTASTNKNKKIEKILASLTHENIADKLHEIAKTSFQAKIPDVEPDASLEEKVIKLVTETFGEAKTQLEKQLEAESVTQLHDRLALEPGQTTAQTIADFVTINLFVPQTLTQQAKKIGDDAAAQLHLDQQEANAIICRFFNAKAQEVINSNTHKATAETLNINAEDLAKAAQQHPAHQLLISELSKEVLDEITDSRLNQRQADTGIDTLLIKKETEIESAIKSALEALDSYQKKKEKIDQLIKAINPTIVIETLTQQAHTTLTQQIEDKGYQADEDLLTELQQSILEITRRQLNAAKAKLRTELLEKSQSELDTLSEEAVIDSLIDTKLESAPNKTLQTQAHEAALKLSKEFMDHFKGATAVDVEKTYLDILRSINRFESDFKHATKILTSRALESWLNEKSTKLAKTYKSIATGEFRNEQSILINKINLTGDHKLNKKEKAAHQQSIWCIDAIEKNQSRISKYLTFLETTRIALEQHIKTNNTDQDQALVNIASPATRVHAVFDTNNPNALLAARNDANTQLSLENQPISTYTDANAYKTIAFNNQQTLMVAAYIQTTPKRAGHKVALKICKEVADAKLYIDSIDNNATYSAGGLFTKKTPIERYSNTPESRELIVHTMLEFVQGKGEDETKKATGVLIINSNRPKWLEIYVELLMHRRLYPKQPFPYIQIEGFALNFLQDDKKKQQFDEKVEKLVTQKIEQHKYLQTSKEADQQEHNIRTNLRNRTQG